MGNKTIEVPECPECGKGMVFTFAFPYNEYACLPCGTMDEYCCRGERITVNEQANERKRQRWQEELHILAIRNGAECTYEEENKEPCPKCDKDKDGAYAFKYYKKNINEK